MKTRNILFIILILGLSAQAIGQRVTRPVKNENPLKDTISLNEVLVTAFRTDIPMKEIPAAISIIKSSSLNSMQKTIAADEALRFVPGTKIDNGTDGSRVHFYIRGQGILSESGFRGIQVLIDGIPVNDPGGYCPDLYDVDWGTVKRVEVVRGLAASLYGGNATGGVVNIITNDGGEKPVNSFLSATAGSYGFWKILGQVDGTQDKINYRVSYSHAQGHGYRDHQSFMSDNFSEKINWTPSEKVKITQILTYTNYFNQNSEGINLYRYDTYGPRAANTDAIPYNEFQETKRLTGALLGKFVVAQNQDIQVKAYVRMNNYRETSNNGDDYKPYLNLGGSAQYNLHFGGEKLMNHLSVGVDYQSQSITEHLFAVPPENMRDSNRVDSHWSRDCYDLSTILVNQIIKQRSAGVYLIDKLDIAKKFYAILNVRYDYVYSSLTNNIPVPDSVSPSGSRTFDKPTFRIGLAYNIATPINLYINYGTGFLTPSNDELYNNPIAWGGFNELIKPSTSQGIEMGVRGDIGKIFHYDVTGFDIFSDNEFSRFSVPGRGNNTAFYKNIGKSNKWGIETSLSFSPVKNVIIDAAYTYSHFRYTAPDYTDTVNGIYNIKGHWLPNSPEHMLTAQISYNFLKNFTVAFGAQWQSKWCIQVDDSIYNQYTIGQTYYQPGSIRSSWVDGYAIFNLNLDYQWKLGWLRGDISLYAKNLFDEQYFGFTEPNNGPDYNSYQPAPGREFFVNLKLFF
ncbi:MAG: TonB-dependent receptor [Bacteroidales bacterium]|nr:TonB-dependent receptor [Bacteroidales bacterium]